MCAQARFAGSVELRKPKQGSAQPYFQYMSSVLHGMGRRRTAGGMVIDGVATTKNVHSNEVESLVYGFVLHRCRDSLNSSECKPELMMLVVSSSSLSVWELAVCEPATCILYWTVYMHKRARARIRLASWGDKSGTPSCSDTVRNNCA